MNSFKTDHEGLLQIPIASDHAGLPLKEFLIQHCSNLRFVDLGTFSADSVDFPDYADKVASSVLKEKSRGILLCGSGQGMAMRANKYPGIRAALCWDVTSCQLARQHNDANVLCLGARLIPFNLAIEIVNAFISTPFEGGRHEKRVLKISGPLETK